MSYVGAVTIPVGVYGLHISFHIHASIRRNDEYSTVWKAANVLISNVFPFPLHHHSKISKKKKRA
jgi:hypothetical protein